MKNKIVSICILWFFWLSFESLYAFRINYLTADNGLTQNLVDHIFKDSRGYIWIATWNGLNRYDGYQFIHFSSRNASNRMRSNVVQCLEEDNDGNLWIGTATGVNIMNFQNGAITPLEKWIGEKYDFTALSIKTIKRDKNGDIWVGHERGLAKIHLAAGEFSTEEVIKNGLGVSSLVFGNDDKIYIGQDNNVARIIKSSNSKYHIVYANNKLTKLNGVVNTLFIDNNLLWIGTSNGLYRFDPLAETLSSYFANQGNTTALTSGYISDIAKSQEGQLLIGTLIGLNIYDYRTDKFSSITSDLHGTGVSLNNNFVNCLFVDDKNIWIGTDKGGINLLRPNQQIFNNIGNIPQNPNSLSKNPVNSIYEDKAGDLWVGTVEGGINYLKKGSSSFVHYYSRLGDTQTLSHNSISAICNDYKGDYWFATWGKGINRLKQADKLKPIFTQFSYSDNYPNGIANDFVAALEPDHQRKGVWIGTRNGLDFLNVDNLKFTHILNYLPVNRQIQLITGLHIDTKNRLWVGTGNGLYCIFLNKTDLTKNRIAYRYFRNTLSNPSSQQVEKINVIIETKDGHIWMGSNGNGLYRLNESGGNYRFVNIDEKEGLLNNYVYGILEDETGSLWLSTDKGICVYDPVKRSFRNYTKADGLVTNQFYWDAYCKGHDGKMYFGSVEGYTVFDPLKASPINTKNRPTITRVSILNEDIYPANVKTSDNRLFFEGSTLSRIELKEADKAFSIEFSALVYSFSEKIKYAYRLNGFDNNWNEVAADRRFANYTNLKAGKYTFEIKCTNPDGTWSEDISSIDIMVFPPFYKRSWFILLALALIIYGTYRYYHHRLNLLKRQKIHLREMVEQRTMEIEHQKVTLEEQATELKHTLEALIEHQEEVSRQNGILTLQNTEITKQKEQLIELSRKVEEATLDKISFFTNITHEFRTPITLISGPIDRALKISREEEVQNQLNIAQRNSRLLLSLINQLMDFRKIDSGKMELTKEQNNFVEFLDDLVLPFESLASERNILFNRKFQIEEATFPFDKDNLQKVIGNLLSNAIKFTPDGGTITIKAITFLDKKEGKEQLYVSVNDSGNGIHEEDKERIFDHFYQSKQTENYSYQNQTGTGIGLYLTKRIIELHNGTIKVVNLKKGGASFRFIIPIDRSLTTFVGNSGNSTKMLIATEGVVEDDHTESLEKGKPLLLIVEDNTDMRLYVRSILQDEYTIIEAANGAIGLELTNRYQPDLIISDIMMPVMNGLDFCKNVKSNFTTSHIPVILLTAKSAPDTQIESFHLGADAFLVKPFNEELLKAMIRNLNERRQRSQLNFSESMDVEALKINEDSQDKKFMDKVIKVIKENYNNSEFDISEFIEEMGVSRSLLHKKLQNLTGQSTTRFIRTYRLNIARELILKNRINHNLNISEIAYQVGFNDPKYFTRCFTKHFGISPSSFLGDEES